MSDKTSPQAKSFRAERARQMKERAALIAKSRTSILDYLAQAQKRVAAAIAAQPSEAAQWQLVNLQREIDQALQTFGSAAAAQIANVAGTAWEGGQALIDEPLRAGRIAIAGIVPALDTTQLLAMRAFMVSRIKDVGAEAARKIGTELGLVAIGAQPSADAVSKVTEILEAGTRARAITIVRTEVGRVYAVATEERMLQAAEAVDELQKQWRRSGKLHSRLTHDLADGQVQDVDQPFRLASGIKLMHPHDPKAPASETINCGCASIPYMARWEMTMPGRKRFTEMEMQANPMKRDIQEQLDSGKSMREILDDQQAA